MHSLSHYQYCLPAGHFFLPRMNLYRHIKITQSPLFTLGFIIGVVHSMNLDKSTVTYIHHYNIQNIFIALKILCILPSHLFLVPIWQSLTFFTVSIVLSFPEWHIVRIIVCSLFSLASFTQ